MLIDDDIEFDKMGEEDFQWAKPNKIKKESKDKKHQDWVKIEGGEKTSRFSWSLVSDGKSNSRVSSINDNLFGNIFLVNKQTKDYDRYREPEEVVPPAEKILLAAALMESSFSGSFMSYYLQEGDRSKVKWYKIYQNSSMIRTILLAFLILLSFFERPLWCFQSNCNAVKDPENIIPGATPQMYFSGIPKLGVYFSISLELFFLLFLWVTNVFLSIKIAGFKNSILALRFEKKTFKQYLLTRKKGGRVR